MRPKSSNATDAGITNDGKLELSLMHFHHTNPDWQMPKQCEAYLEKIQERGTQILSQQIDLLIESFPIAVEDVQGSSILQQSMTDMQTLQGQRSFYSDPLCKLFSMEKRKELKLVEFVSATTPLHNRSVISKPFYLILQSYKTVFSMVVSQKRIYPIEV